MSNVSSRSDNWLEKIVRWGVYAVALIPIVVFNDFFPIYSNFFSPFHFGKVVVLRTLVGLLFVAWVALVLKDRSYLPKKSSLLWAVIIWTGSFLLTSIFSVNPLQSFMGTLERMGGFFTFLHFLAFLVIALSVLRTKEHWYRLLEISVAAGVVSLMYGVLQKAPMFRGIMGSGDRLRIFGTLGNTALFAGYQLVTAVFAGMLLFLEPIRERARKAHYMIALVPMVILTVWPVMTAKGLPWYISMLPLLGSAILLSFFLTKANSAKNMVYYALVIVLNLAAILSTGVRGALIGLFLGGIVFVILLFLKGKSRTVKWSFAAVIIFLVVAELLLVINHNAPFVKNSQYLSRISDISLDSTTVQTRLRAWRAGIQGWDDSAKTVLLGWGPENFQIPFSNNFDPFFYTGPNSETLFDRAHNMFVESLVTMGLVGLVAYIAVFVVLFRYLFALRRAAQSTEMQMAISTAIAGLVAYIGHNLFFFDTTANFIVFFIFIGIVIFLKQVMADGEAVEAKGSIIGSTGSRYIAVAVLLVAVLFGIYKADWLPLRANNIATRGVTTAAREKDHVKAIAYWKQAVAYDTYITDDLMNESTNRYALYVLQNIPAIEQQGVDIEQLLLEIIAKEEEFAQQNGDIEYLPHLVAARAYIILGSGDPASEYNDKALVHAERALELSPTFIRTYFEVAQVYLNKEEYDKAVDVFKEAIALNPEVGVSYWYLAAAYEQMGRSDDSIVQARIAVEKGFGPSENEYIVLINSYLNADDLSHAAVIYERLIASVPQSENLAQYHASVATVYAQLGDIDNAVMHAVQAVEVDPSFESDARTFVESLGRPWPQQ